MASSFLNSSVRPDAALRVIDAALARRKLYDFGKQAWPLILPHAPFTAGWHLGCLAEHLEALTYLQIDQLIVNIPPRSGKSIWCAVIWPAWVWLSDPASQWAFFSYDRRLAQRDAVRMRDLVRTRWYRESFEIPWDIREDVDAKDLFKNTRQGVRISSTPGSLGTGIDADYLVADDAGNVADAASLAKLETTSEWWDATTTTRGNNPRAFRRLIIQQRYHDRDLSGHVLASGQGWHHLCLPARHEGRRHFPTWEAALASGEEYPIVPTPVQVALPQWRDLRTEEGAPLWPERFGEAELARLEVALGHHAEGQLQQRPRPAQGGIFRQEFFRYGRPTLQGMRIGLTLLPGPQQLKDGLKPVWVALDDLRFFQTIDTALTASSRSSFTAVGTYALTPHADLIVWDAFRAHLEVPFQYPMIAALRSGPCTWNETKRVPEPCQNHLGEPMTWPRPLLFQAIENKASGLGLIQLGAAQGTPFKTLRTGTQDKVERAAPVASMYALGKVYHREGAAFLSAFEGELRSFPTGATADWADCTAYAGQLLQHDVILRSYLRHDLIGLWPEAVPEADLGPPEQFVTASGEIVTLESGPEDPADLSPWL